MRKTFVCVALALACLVAIASAQSPSDKVYLTTYTPTGISGVVKARRGEWKTAPRIHARQVAREFARDGADAGRLDRHPRTRGAIGGSISAPAHGGPAPPVAIRRRWARWI